MGDTPNIRFKGFTDDWEQRKLVETLYSLQNNTLSRAELSLEDGVAKNVHYGDILVKFGELSEKIAILLKRRGRPRQLWRELLELDIRILQN